MHPLPLSLSSRHFLSEGHTINVRGVGAMEIKKKATVEIKKKVTDPLDERARDRLCGGGDLATRYVSSGSEHEADSFSLAGLIHGFMEDDGGDERETFDPKLSDGETVEALEELFRPSDHEDGCFRSSIRVIIGEAISRAEESDPRSLVRRAVLTKLRESGFNAGICKTKWETSGGLTAGHYEYIDVIASGTELQRYVVYIDFAGEFEIARPTVKYAALLTGLPRVLVCRSDELRRVIRIAAQAAKRSMKAQGLHLPPWRRNRYMQAKWFGPYRRTTNTISTVLNPHDSFRRPVVGFDARKCVPISVALAYKPGFSAGIKVAPL